MFCPKKSDNFYPKMCQYHLKNMTQGTKCFSTPMLYTIDVYFYNLSEKMGSISFFSSSEMQQFHHLLGCHTIGHNSSLIFF